MAGSAKNISVKFVHYHTSLIVNGALNTATDLGIIAPGSTLVQPNILYEKYAAGMMDVGGDLAQVVRVFASDGAAWFAALQTAGDANPKTEVFMYLTNKSKTKYWAYACVLGKVMEVQPENEAARQAVQIPFFCDGDDVDDFLTTYDAAVTV